MSTENKNGGLNAEEEFLALDPDSMYFVSAQEEAKIESDAKLKMISIRLENSMITSLKDLAEYHDMGYQPLIREVLARFVEGEEKRLFKRYLKEADKAKFTGEIDKEQKKRA